jgi:hypothetical protein
MCVGVKQLHGFASSPEVSDIATVAPRDVARAAEARDERRTTTCGMQFITQSWLFHSSFSRRIVMPSQFFAIGARPRAVTA